LESDRKIATSAVRRSRRSLAATKEDIIMKNSLVVIPTEFKVICGRRRKISHQHEWLRARLKIARKLSTQHSGDDSQMSVDGHCVVAGRVKCFDSKIAGQSSLVRARPDVRELEDAIRFPDMCDETNRHMQKSLVDRIMSRSLSVHKKQSKVLKQSLRI
jgi:hypothetical protein